MNTLHYEVRRDRAVSPVASVVARLKLLAEVGLMFTAPLLLTLLIVAAVIVGENWL